MTEEASSSRSERPPGRPGLDRSADDAVRRLEGIGSRATRIVEDAASILEEELANGIGVARNVEQRIFRSGGREHDPEAIVSRFRKDAHEIIDLAVDVLGGAMESLGGLTSRAVAVRDSTESAIRAPRAPRVPTLTVPEPVAPGASADVAMSVENDSDQPTERFGLNASDLVSSSGDRIPAAQVKFTPKALKIEPAATARITVKLAVPASTPPGTYSGVLQATKLEPVRAVLVVTVE